MDADSLDAVRPSVSPRYEAALLRVFDGAWNAEAWCLRMPSFSPESVVGVRRARAAAYEAFVFTPSAHIWATLMSRDASEDGSAIVAGEHVATLDAYAADRVISAWEAMLGTVAPGRPPRLGLDGQCYRFGRASGGMLGETWSPLGRSRAGALVSLVTTLADYAFAIGDVRKVIRVAEDVIAHPRASG